MLSKPDISEAIGALLRGPESKRVAEKLGWDSSQVSRFLNGQQGIGRDQLNVIIELCDLVVVSRRYLDAISLLASTGVSCECARNGMGECGRR